MPEPRRFCPFSRPAVLACGLALCLLFALPAAASADDSVNVSLCKQILSRMLCKNISEFSYVGKPEKDVYIIGVFYASKPSEMLCAVLPDGQVIIQDRTWRAMNYRNPATGDWLYGSLAELMELAARRTARFCASQAPSLTAAGALKDEGSGPTLDMGLPGVPVTQARYFSPNPLPTD